MANDKKNEENPLANLTPEMLAALKALLAPAPQAPGIDADTLASALKKALAPPDMQEMTKSMFNIEAIAKAQREAGTIVDPVRVKCQHPNGYLYTAVVVPSREFKGGRVVSIEDEIAPEIEWPKNGSHHDEKGELNIHGKHYIWETFRQPLFREVIGKELPWFHRLDMKHHYERLKAEFDAKAAELNARMAAEQNVMIDPREPETPTNPGTPQAKHSFPSDHINQGGPLPPRPVAR